jgi:hypothetical protein
MKSNILFTGLALIAVLVLASCTDLLLEAKKADKTFVEADSATLAIGLPAGDSLSQVRGNLSLPTSIQGTTIAWVSANPAVVSATGVIARPAFDAGSTTVSLVATITAGSETRTKAFTITVLPLEPTDAQAIGADRLALEVALGGSDVSGFVTQDLSLPTSGGWGTTITWTSDKPGIISSSGAVQSDLIDEVVVLTATVSRGHGTSETRDFTFTVKATGSAAVTIGLPTAPAATDLVFRDSGNVSISTFVVESGATVTVNTSFAGTFSWYVDSDSGSLSSASTCLLAGNDYTLGLHTLMIDALSGGKSWSGQILFKVVTP